jgi:hypothetical protein
MEPEDRQKSFFGVRSIPRVSPKEHSPWQEPDAPLIKLGFKRDRRRVNLLRPYHWVEKNPP